MKTNKSVECQMSGVVTQVKRTGEWKPASVARLSRHASLVTRLRGRSRFGAAKARHSPAFTLVELLTVISIIGILAAFTVPALFAVTKNREIKQTQAEMGQLQAAIEAYKVVYGFYPPSNPNGLLGNQLYYELTGTTNDGTSFVPLQGGDSIALTQMVTAFGLAGFMNCSKPGSSEESQGARDFLHELRPNQMGICSNNNVGVTILVGSVGGPDLKYTPLGAQNLNPWRYVAPGTNNPTSYDLWIQLKIGSKTNLICNWTREVQVNNPLP
jgi:prepilin-type N-terminal cleavage/methylation domain-containing protein